MPDLARNDSLTEVPAHGVDGMEVAFETRVLRLICESAVVARRRLPGPVAENLLARMADLQSVMASADLKVSACSVDARPPGSIVFTLGRGYELVCVGNHPDPVLASEGLIDFTRLRRLKVVAIARQKA